MSSTERVKCNLFFVRGGKNYPSKLHGCHIQNLERRKIEIAIDKRNSQLTMK
jgi:hypothetical protein